MKQTDHEQVLESLAKILKRVPADRFQRQAMAMVQSGEMPPAELLKRCGIRDTFTMGEL